MAFAIRTLARGLDCKGRRKPGESQAILRPDQGCQTVKQLADALCLLEGC
jgi:hypothetical protein